MSALCKKTHPRLGHAWAPLRRPGYVQFSQISQSSFYLPLFMLYPNPITMKGSIRIRVRNTTSRILNIRSIYVRTRCSRATLAVPYYSVHV